MTLESMISAEELQKLQFKNASVFIFGSKENPSILIYFYELYEGVNEFYFLNQTFFYTQPEQQFYKIINNQKVTAFFFRENTLYHWCKNQICIDIAFPSQNVSYSLPEKLLTDLFTRLFK
jgi:hypothetical protein